MEIKDVARHELTHRFLSCPCILVSYDAVMVVYTALEIVRGYGGRHFGLDLQSAETARWLSHESIL